MRFGSRLSSRCSGVTSDKAEGGAVHCTHLAGDPSDPSLTTTDLMRACLHACAQYTYECLAATCAHYLLLCRIFDCFRPYNERRMNCSIVYSSLTYSSIMSSYVLTLNFISFIFYLIFINPTFCN